MEQSVQNTYFERFLISLWVADWNIEADKIGPWAVQGLQNLDFLTLTFRSFMYSLTFSDLLQFPR